MESKYAVPQMEIGISILFLAAFDICDKTKSLKIMLFLGKLI